MHSGKTGRPLRAALSKRYEVGNAQAPLQRRRRPASTSLVSAHPLCNRQAPLRLDQLGGVNLVPPTVAGRLRDNAPALGNLQVQGRNLARDRRSKLDDGTIAARRLGDNLRALGSPQFQRCNPAPERGSDVDYGTHRSEPIVVGGEELQLANAPSVGELRTTAVRVSANAPRLAFPLTPGPSGDRAASCREAVCDKILAQLCRNCIEL